MTMTMASDFLFQLKKILEDSEYDSGSEYNLLTPNNQILPESQVAAICEILHNLSAWMEMTDEHSHKNTRRTQAIENGAYDVITTLWVKFFQTGNHGLFSASVLRDSSEDLEKIMESLLNTLYVLTPGFPDVADVTGFLMIRQAIHFKVPVKLQLLGMKIIKNVCTKCEDNRETLVTIMRIVPSLVQLIRRRHPNSEFLREWCSTLRSLVLNDDRQVTYNRSVERKRVLFQEHVVWYLCKFLTSNEFHEGSTQNAIIILLCSMAYNEENVETMIRYGILPFLSKILSTKTTNSERPEILENAISCLAYMTLRCQPHIERLLFLNELKDIMDLVVKHIDSIPIMKNTCFLLRNVAVHGGKSGRKMILDNGAENLINQLVQKHPELKYNYTKPLIRDLGLPVTPTMPPATTSMDLITPIIGIAGEKVELRTTYLDYRLENWNMFCTKSVPTERLPAPISAGSSLMSVASVSTTAVSMSGHPRKPKGQHRF